MSQRRRLDAELVRRGLVPSRARAKELIDDDLVTVGGAVAAKAGRMVDAGEAIELLAPPPRFVGRGGEKLRAALDRFDVEAAGRRALDVGSSTGGFTDCLLQHGATTVTAVDVGRGQLHERLRADDRVVVRERTDARDLTIELLDGAAAQLVVADVSFISLRAVMEAMRSVSTDDADWILLVKPQFEAGRREASRGRGVIRDPTVWLRVLDEVGDALVPLRVGIMGVMPSPIRGAEGNVEFLVHGRVGAPVDADRRRLAVEEAVAEATTRHRAAGGDE
ncbi:MAG: TlyA family RNA methyltransferase [Actinomycetota bacterium]